MKKRVEVATEQPPSMFEEDAQLGKVAAESLGDKMDEHAAPAVEVEKRNAFAFRRNKGWGF